MGYLIGMFLLAVFVAVAIAMMFFVLIQQAKGGGLAGAFGGGGGSEAIFGPSGATGVAKLTIVLAVSFILLALVIEIIGPSFISPGSKVSPNLNSSSGPALPAENPSGPVAPPPDPQ